MKNTNLKRPFQLAKDVFGSANKNMASHEELSYQDTKSFLLAHRDIRIAKLGYTCLELNEGLGLCHIDRPWAINPEGDGARYHWVALLAQDAAIKSHFYLTAAFSPRPYLEYGQLRILVSCDVERLEMALQRVVSFLQNLVHFLSVNRLNQAINTQAKDLLDDLKKLIVLTLDEIPIDQHALDLFRSG
ncbi:hypothetical protein C8R42DRAFT_729822 [Lentinula raphanica]|nr:hypothetical protein C8R42DRAFT_729822 [Lentinula raphanica]